MNLPEEVNALRDAIAKYCAIIHNQTPEYDDRVDGAEIRLDHAMRRAHALRDDEAIEEIHINVNSLVVTTDTGRTIIIGRGIKFIAWTRHNPRSN